MPTETVKRDMEHLRNELQAIDDGEGATPQEVTSMLEHVNQALDSFEDATHQRNLLDHIRESIAVFEAEHPQLVAQINSLMIGLSNAGI